MSERSSRESSKSQGLWSAPDQAVARARNGWAKVAAQLLAEAEFLVARNELTRALRHLTRAWEAAKRAQNPKLRAKCCLRLSQVHESCGLGHLAACYLQFAITAEMETWPQTPGRGDGKAGGIAMQAALQALRARRRQGASRADFQGNPEWN